MVNDWQWITKHVLTVDIIIKLNDIHVSNLFIQLNLIYHVCVSDCFHNDPLLYPKGPLVSLIAGYSIYIIDPRDPTSQYVKPGGSLSQVVTLKNLILFMGSSPFLNRCKKKGGGKTASRWLHFFQIQSLKRSTFLLERWVNGDQTLSKWWAQTKRNLSAYER